MAQKRKNINKTALFSSLILLLMSVSLLFTFSAKLGLNLPSWNKIQQSLGLAEKTEEVKASLSVHFIDVGQGDSALIKSGDFSVLIDGGERDKSEKLINYLRNQGITKIDCIVASHPHSDHIGGLIKVMRTFEIGSVIMPKLSAENIPTTNVYEDFLSALQKSGASVLAANPGDAYEFGDIKFSVLSPLEDDSELNNMSVVFKLNYEDKSVLFVADIENAAENRLLDSGADLSADILKVAHHGSSTSSSKEFLSAVSPEYAVICCGDGNSYNHPNGNTLKTLKNLNIKTYRTDYNGDIVFSFTEKSSHIDISTSKTEFEK